MTNNFKNALGAFFIFLLAYLFYKYNIDYFNILNNNVEFNFNFLQKSLGVSTSLVWKSNTWDLLQQFFLIYGAYFVFYYLWWGDNEWKPIFFWRGIKKLILKLSPKNFNKQILNKEEKLAMLTMLVKFIYIPLMFTWFFTNLQSVVNILGNIDKYLLEKNFFYKSDTFIHFYFRHIHRLLFNLLFFIDVSIFLFGYTIELNFLNNKIKSVEPTLFGWLVALSCYPLLNNYTNTILGWHSSNMPDFVALFGEKISFYNLSMIFGLLFVILIWIYVRASIALGFKASNLTNRWIVSHWPYKYIRHPAYICKNLARIIWWLPVIVWLFTSKTGLDFKMILAVTGSLIWWCLIYHLRALTEERHLLQDPDYIEYTNKVKYMYIPKVF